MVHGLVRFNIPGVGIGTATPTSASRSFIVQAMRDAKSGLSTGLAIISTEATSTIQLTLRDSGGIIIPGGSTNAIIPAGGHTARFIHEVFPDADTREFSGSVTVSSENGPISGVAIQLGLTTGEFTTFPGLPIQ
jgi:hypothetical protein